MIIILEGLERTGKSTIASIFEKHGFVNFKDHVHTRNFTPDHMADRFSAILSFLVSLDKSGIDVVVDRYYFSDYLYGTIKRKYDSSCYNHIWLIDEVLSHLNTHIIYLKRKIDETYAAVYPDLVSISQINLMNDKFEYLIDKSYIKDKTTIDISKIDNLDKFVEDFIMAKKKYDFYLASPFFTKEQIEREEKVKNELRNAGFTVYAPREHGVVGSLADRFFVTKIFDSNVKAINDSKMVLSITDGKDMGTVWESGYAYANKIPIVYYAETLGDNSFNIMLSESAIGICKNIEQLKKMCSTKNFKNRDGVVLNYE